MQKASASLAAKICFYDTSHMASSSSNLQQAAPAAGLGTAMTHKFLKGNASTVSKLSIHAF